MARIGSKTERIGIERKSRTKRADFGNDTTPGIIAQVWANVKPTGGGESQQAGRQAASTLYLITLDRLTDVVPSDTLVWMTGGDVRMNIREVRLPPQRDLDLEIVAEVGAVL